MSDRHRSRSPRYRKSTSPKDRKSRRHSRSSDRYRNRSRDRRVASSSRSRCQYVWDDHRERDRPKPSKCLGVFGLSRDTTEEDLYDIFTKYGPIEKVQIIYDADSHTSRGFSFIYFKKLEDARIAKSECSGMKVSNRTIRVDFSITNRPHSPTPGYYMGNYYNRDTSPDSPRRQRSYRKNYDRHRHRSRARSRSPRRRF